jgi:hypothetical protein
MTASNNAAEREKQLVALSSVLAASACGRR